MENFVRVFVKVEGTPSCDEDESVPGIYLIEVDAGLSPPDQASAARDIFHDNVGIEDPDTLTFRVVDEGGAEMDENPDHESHSLANRGEFHGYIRPLPETKH